MPEAVVTYLLSDLLFPSLRDERPSSQWNAKPRRGMILYGTGLTEDTALCTVGALINDELGTHRLYGEKVRIISNMKIILILNFNTTMIKYEHENTFIRIFQTRGYKTKKLNSRSRASSEAVTNLSHLL